MVIHLILDGGWIETTPKHPFYVEGKGWTDAEDLQIGDQIRQADGRTGTVWLRWNVHKTQEMYNLTVDTAHTFFVGEGQWLVHNDCPLVFGPSAGGKLREFANKVGGELLTDLPKPTELDWIDFSKQTLDQAAKTKRSVYFDLTHMEDVRGVLKGTGRYANTITGHELRYIANSWSVFEPVVTFFYKSRPIRLPR